MFLNKEDAIKLVSHIKQEFSLKPKYESAIDAIDKIIERMHAEKVDEWSVLVIFKHLLNISIETTELKIRKEYGNNQETKI